jgi:hypothetical protein
VRLRHAPAAEPLRKPLAFRLGAPEPLSDGEVHFLYWLIQGSIMSPDTRQRLWRAWGLCQRHACGFITVDAMCRHGRMHGPALLYADLMTRAQQAFRWRGPLWAWRIAWALRDKGPCLMCDVGSRPTSPSSAPSDLIARSRDPTEIRAFARRTRAFWEDTVCGRCVDESSGRRCRPRLVEDVRHGSVADVAQQRALVADISRRVGVYAQSFCWESRGIDTEAEQMSRRHRILCWPSCGTGRTSCAWGRARAMGAQAIGYGSTTMSMCASPTGARGMSWRALPCARRPDIPASTAARSRGTGTTLGACSRCARYVTAA